MENPLGSFVHSLLMIILGRKFRYRIKNVGAGVPSYPRVALLQHGATGYTCRQTIMVFAVTSSPATW